MKNTDFAALVAVTITRKRCFSAILFNNRFWKMQILPCFDKNFSEHVIVFSVECGTLYGRCEIRWPKSECDLNGELPYTIFIHFIHRLLVTPNHVRLMPLSDKCSCSNTTDIYYLLTTLCVSGHVRRKKEKRHWQFTACV